MLLLSMLFPEKSAFDACSAQWTFYWLTIRVPIEFRFAWKYLPTILATHRIFAFYVFSAHMFCHFCFAEYLLAESAFSHDMHLEMTDHAMPDHNISTNIAFQLFSSIMCSSMLVVATCRAESFLAHIAFEHRVDILVSSMRVLHLVILQAAVLAKSCIACLTGEFFQMSSIVRIKKFFFFSNEIAEITFESVLMIIFLIYGLTNFSYN